MLKGQKSVRGGIEDFLCPFTDMFITQGSGGSYSHKGTMANDVRGTQTGVKYPYYAPCTCKCVKAYPESGQAMWQSTNKVRFANGRIDYATFMTAHDDSFDAEKYIGVAIPQGNKIGNMGKKGNATGVHCHIQISQSKTTSWSKNSYGIYKFPNEYDTDACYFMDGTNILEGMGGSWKYLKDVPVDEPKTEAPTEPKVDEDKVKIAELENQIKDLTTTIELQRDEIKNRNAVIDGLEPQIITLENRIVEVTEERDKLITEQPREIFTCAKTGDYQIKLFKNEKLFIR